MPTTIVDSESVADDAELRALAVAHVARVRARCPQFASVDEGAQLGVVERHLAPLPADRAWTTRRRWQAPRGEPTWLGGAVGLHVPRAREAS